MAARLNLRDLAAAIVIAVVLGVAVGLGLWLLARQLGWSLRLVGPVTGGVVGVLVPLIYTVRQKRAALRDDRA